MTSLAARTLESLAPIALVVLLVYLAVLVLLGWMSWRRSDSTEDDYWLAGRRQGWLVSGLTILATYFSSFALLGAPGLVYRDGVAFALFAFNVPLAAAVILLFAPRIAGRARREGHITPADLLAAHYGESLALRLLIAATGFLYAVPYIVIQLEAGGLLTASLFPDTARAFEIGVHALAVVTVLYILIGGMRSVCWTDSLQGLLLVGGMFLAGAAVVSTLGGPSNFASRLSDLPPDAQTVPGTTGAWSPGKTSTACIIAALGSMLQPAQWMRFCAADSGRSIRRSALLVALLLPLTYLVGVLLVGLGGRLLYPLVRFADGRVAPHGDVDPAGKAFDQILPTVLRDCLPELVGPTLGAVLLAVVGVAILAASMSTADSNLHAVSAVFSRDVWGRAIRRRSSERERTWVGRATILLATLLSLGIIAVKRRNPDFPGVQAIVELGLLAMAFSAQLLPLAVDALWLRRGTRGGAIAGLATGLVLVAVTFLLSGRSGDLEQGPLKSLWTMWNLPARGFLPLLANGLVFAAWSGIQMRRQATRESEEHVRVQKSTS